jgi:hypothetical protein
MRNRTFGVLAVSIVLVLAFAGSASALSASAGAGGLAGSATSVETNTENTVVAKASANYTGVVNGGGVTFAWECDGQGIGAAAATSMVRCYLSTNGSEYDAPNQINLPGNVVASAQTATLDFDEIGDTVRVCAVVRVLPIIGSSATATACVDEGVGIDPATT